MKIIVIILTLIFVSFVIFFSYKNRHNREKFQPNLDNNLFDQIYDSIKPDFNIFMEYATAIYNTYYLYNLSPGLNINQPLSPIIINYMNYLQDTYGYSDLTLLIGNQSNIVRNTYNIFGFIAKDRNGKGFICMRGTQSFRDWLSNFNYSEEKINTCLEFRGISDNLKCCKGDILIFGAERSNNKAIISKTIKDWVLNHPDVSEYNITGHSLGASQATLAAYLIKKMLGKFVNSVYLFASKRTMNRAAQSDYNNLLYNRTYNFFNNQDLVHQAPTSIVNIDGSFLGFNIPFTTPGYCYGHVGIQLGIDYLSDKWPKTEEVAVSVHNILSGVIEIKEIWRDRIFSKYINNPPNSLFPTNSLSRPTYSKFLNYSNILGSFYNNEFLRNSFSPNNAIPNNLLITLRNFANANQISQISPIICTEDRTIFSDRSFLCGFIGVKDKRGIIGFGVDYENFPIEQPSTRLLPESWDVSNFDNILENNFRGTKISTQIRDYYFINCQNNRCIKNQIDLWLRNNSTINNFTIIGQGFGGCFAQLAALQLYSNNKNVRELYLYGSLKLGDINFSRKYNELFGNNTYLFQNIQDPYVSFLPYWSNYFARIFQGQFNMFENVGKQYYVDIPVDKCNMDMLKKLRIPQSYSGIREWQNVIEKDFDELFLIIP